MQLVVDELLTNYRSLGNGQPILLVHGWGDNSLGLQALQKQLARSYRVIALDLPGFGASQAPNTAWGLTDYARFCAHFLDKIDVKPYAHIGHSNGGAILLRGIRNKALSAERLVLLSSAGIRSEDSMRKSVIHAVTKTGKLFAHLLPPSAQTKLRRKVYQSVGSDMLLNEQLTESFKLIVADDVQKDAALITIPVLLIYGDKDAATPVRYGQQLQQAIRGSRLEILPDAGHFAHLDQPEIVFSLIMEFLK